MVRYHIIKRSYLESDTRSIESKLASVEWLGAAIAKALTLERW